MKVNDFSLKILVITYNNKNILEIKYNKIFKFFLFLMSNPEILKLIKFLIYIN